MITELYKLLEDNGFKITANIRIEVKKFAYKDIIEEVKNKDMSQLQIISEEDYVKGVNKMEEDSKTNECIIGDVAFTEIYGVKRIIVKVARKLVDSDLIDLLKESELYHISEMPPLKEWVGKTIRQV
jgi:hypothetical protein